MLVVPSPAPVLPQLILCAAAGQPHPSQAPASLLSTLTFHAMGGAEGEPAHSMRGLRQCRGRSDIGWTCKAGTRSPPQAELPENSQCQAAAKEVTPDTRVC